MNDRRIAVFREAFEMLLDSIQAVSRLQRWDVSDPIPESLTQSARLLDARLEKAKALGATSYVGNAQVVSRLDILSSGIRRLVQSYGVFADAAKDPTGIASALDALDVDVDEVRDATQV